MSKSFPRAKATANLKDVIFTVLVMLGVFEVLCLALSLEFYRADDKAFSFRLFAYFQIVVVLLIILVIGLFWNVDYSNNKILDVSPLKIEGDTLTVVYLSPDKAQTIKKEEIDSVESFADMRPFLTKKKRIDNDYYSYGRLSFLLKNGKKVDCGLLENVSEVRDEVDAWLKEDIKKEPIAM